MEPTDLRVEILRLVEQNEVSGTYLDDTSIGAQLEVPLADVQRQMLILENRQLVELVKTFGPTYEARLTANGMEALEEANQPSAEQPSARRIGFK
jgi:hypothetical protein